LTPFVVVAHGAEEEEHRTAMGRSHLTFHCPNIDRTIHQRRKVRRGVTSPRNGWQQGDLTAIVKSAVPADQFTIDGDSKAIPQNTKVGEAFLKFVLQIREASGIGKVEVERRPADNLAGGGKGNYMYSHDMGCYQLHSEEEIQQSKNTASKFALATPYLRRGLR
jgi:hypothetical protein